MNHNCLGDWIPSLNLYRCLMDGEFIETKTLPSVCEHCHRNVDMHTLRVIEHPRTRAWKVTEIEIPQFGWVVMERKIIP